MSNTDAIVVDTAVLTESQKIKELQAKVLELETELSLASEHEHEIDAGYETNITSFENRIKELEKKNADLVKKSKTLSVPSGDYVVFKGETHQIIGDFRADANFDQVKKGHCDEGITLIAIARLH